MSPAPAAAPAVVPAFIGRVPGGQGVFTAPPLPRGVTLQQPDGGFNYYQNNGHTNAYNAGWDSPYFFPIGVWYGSVLTQSDANRWLDLGLNTSWRTQSNTLISLLAANGIWAVVSDTGTGPECTGTIGAETVGLLAADEPASMANWESSIQNVANSEQDPRYWWVGFNWNQINYNNLGGTLMPQVMTTLVTTPNSTTRFIDVTSADIYWYSGSRDSTGYLLNEGGLIYNLGQNMTADQAARGPHYGDMVDAIRNGWFAPVGISRPIHQIIENGDPGTDSNATAASYIQPAEMNCAVWSSIIHGARQISYFNHSFCGPAQSNDCFADAFYQTLQGSQTITIYNQAKATNALVKQMAPVINSWTALGYVTVSPPAVRLTSTTADSGIETLAKYLNGNFYIFADTRASESTTNISATFTTADGYNGPVSVINESRTITATNGVFTDTFANGMTIHIYKMGPL